MNDSLQNILKKLGVICLVGLGMTMPRSTFGQETQYTQYNYTPLLTNPSMIGTQSIVSATALHRSYQLADQVDFNSSILTIVAPQLNQKQTRRLGGLGLSLMHNTLKNNYSFVLQGVSLGYAYNLALYKHQYLSFGMQAAYQQRKIAMDGYTTGSQWDNLLGFDSDAAIGENIDNGMRGYVTAGAGMTYYIEDEDENHTFYVGASAFNINKPNMSFAENEDLASLRYSGQFGVTLLKSKKYRLGPELVYIHANHLNVYQVGVRGKYYFKNSNPYDVLKNGEIDIKTSYRVNNSVTFEMQFHQPNFSFGLSYDFAISEGQRAGAYNSAFEVMLSLRKIFKRKKKNDKATSLYTEIGEVRNFYYRRNLETEPKQQIQDNSPDNLTELNEFGEGTFRFKLKQDFKFDFNGAQLNDGARSYLDEMAELLATNPGITVEVVGHTDNVGSKEVNEQVSTLRAASVVDYLVEQGVDRSRLKITARGATTPIVPNDTEANKAQNRRVEFIIYSK